MVVILIVIIVVVLDAGWGEWVWVTNSAPAEQQQRSWQSQSTAGRDDGVSGAEEHCQLTRTRQLSLSLCLPFSILLSPKTGSSHSPNLPLFATRTLLPPTLRHSHSPTSRLRLSATLPHSPSWRLAMTSFWGCRHLCRRRSRSNWMSLLIVNSKGKKNSSF